MSIGYNIAPSFREVGPVENDPGRYKRLIDLGISGPIRLLLPQYAPGESPIPYDATAEIQAALREGFEVILNMAPTDALRRLLYSDRDTRSWYASEVESVITMLPLDVWLQPINEPYVGWDTSLSPQAERMRIHGLYSDILTEEARSMLAESGIGLVIDEPCLTDGGVGRIGRLLPLPCPYVECRVMVDLHCYTPEPFTHQQSETWRADGLTWPMKPEDVRAALAVGVWGETLRARLNHPHGQDWSNDYLRCWLGSVVGQRQAQGYRVVVGECGVWAFQRPDLAPGKGRWFRALYGAARGLEIDVCPWASWGYGVLDAGLRGWQEGLEPIGWRGDGGWSSASPV